VKTGRVVGEIMKAIILLLLIALAALLVTQALAT